MKKRIILLSAFFVGISVAGMAQKKGMGMTFNNKAYLKTPMIAKPLGFGQNLPKSFSLREYVPEIGDQGQTGTCTAWASTYYAASMEYAILNKDKDKNRISAYAYDPFMTYLNIISIEENEEGTCQNGTYPGDACERLLEYGVKRININPFDCSSKSSSYSYPESTCDVDFTDYNRLFSMEYNWATGENANPDSFEDVITSVCQTLVNNHPVIIGMGLKESFFNIGSDGVYNVANGSQEEAGGHAMCVVGYDDNKYGGSFLVVNSWGSGWGEKGYLYVKYQDFYDYTWYAFSLVTELKERPQTGCQFGDCVADYGVMKYNTKKMQGTAEGFFTKGVLTKGIYTNSGTISSKESKTIDKIIKKNPYAATVLYNESGSRIGYIMQ